MATLVKVLRKAGFPRMTQQSSTATSFWEASTCMCHCFPEWLCSEKRPCTVLQLLPRVALQSMPGHSDNRLHNYFLGWPCRACLANKSLHGHFLEQPGVLRKIIHPFSEGWGGPLKLCLVTLGSGFPCRSHFPE